MHECQKLLKVVNALSFYTHELYTFKRYKKQMHVYQSLQLLPIDDVALISHFSHLWSLSVVSSCCSFEQTDGTQHLPLYMTKLKSPAARRCFPSAPFPSQPAEAGHEKEDAAADACDEADVHALVGRGGH
jgi:hypothetical protein